jgi:long-chain acyl-CoA synthetase
MKTKAMPNGMNGTLSFAQVDEMSDALAIYLREVAGLAAGDRVAVQMPNCWASRRRLRRLQGGLRAGEREPALHRRGDGQAVRGCRTARAHHHRHVRRQGAGRHAGHPIPNIIVTRVAEFFPSMPRGIVGLVQKYWDRPSRRSRLPHIRLPDAIAAGRAHRANDHVEVSDYSASGAGRCAVLQYTGGTTGVSKGAMLTHAT